MSPESPDYGQEAREAALDNGGHTADFINIQMGRTGVSGSAELPRPQGANRDRSQWGNKRIGGGDPRDDEVLRRGRELTVDEKNRSDEALVSQRDALADSFDMALWERVVSEVPINTYDPSKSDRARELKYAAYQQAKRGGRYR